MMGYDQTAVQEWFPKPSKDLCDPTKPMPLVFRGKLKSLLTPGRELSDSWFGYKDMWRMYLQCTEDHPSRQRLRQLTFSIFGHYAFKTLCPEVLIPHMVVHLGSKPVLDQAKALEGQWVTVTLRISGPWVFEALDIELDPKPFRFKKHCCISPPLLPEFWNIVCSRTHGTSCPKAEKHYWEYWSPWWVKAYPACLDTLYTKPLALPPTKPPKPSAPPLPFAPPTKPPKPSAPKPSAPPKPLTPSTNTETKDNDCVVCMDKAKCVAILPCRHLCICASCTDAITFCPICRGPKGDTLELYIS